MTKILLRQLPNLLQSRKISFLSIARLSRRIFTIIINSVQDWSAKKYSRVMFLIEWLFQLSNKFKIVCHNTEILNFALDCNEMIGRRKLKPLFIGNLIYLFFIDTTYKRIDYHRSACLVIGLNSFTNIPVWWSPPTFQLWNLCHASRR